ncbi:unnamed protein product [Trichobilharzia szidati]|nr:unnamed protein product [Trichobilharzia szidati]
MRFRVFQVFAFTPFFVICCPLFFMSAESENQFRRLSIANLGLTDVQSGWKVFGLLVLSIALYFLVTGFCFTEAYTWPRRLKICNSWKTMPTRSNNDKYGGQPAAAVIDNTNVNEQNERRTIDDDFEHCECDRINQIPNVIMLTGVRSDTTEESPVREIKTFFDTFHPDITVKWIEPVYLVRQLMELEQAKNETEIYLQTAIEELETTGKQQYYYKSTVCCHSLGLCKSKVNAIEVYNEQLNLLETQINTFKTLGGVLNIEFSVKEKGKYQSDMLNIPHTGIVFVGVENSEQAIKFLSAYTVCPLHVLPIDNTLNLKWYCKEHRPWRRLYSLKIPKRSKVFKHARLAPPASDLLWLNLTSTTYHGYRWWLRVIGVRLAVILMAFLLTSPVYVLTVVNFTGLFDWLGKIARPFVFKWFPAAILAGTSVILTRLVITSEYWTRHKTRGGLESVVYRNAYWFLFFTILVFPSLGITGFPALLYQVITTEYNPSDPFTYYVPFQLECIFLPDSGSLFINYVVTCGLLGAGLQLLRLDYIIRRLIKRTFYSHTLAEKKVFSEPQPETFAFGEKHAFLSVVHTVIIAYTPVCPLIYFFGLVYFLFTYLIDKYMLVWVYTPLQSDIRGWSETDSNNYRYIYHLKWFIESTRFSLAGICMGTINISAFYLLRWSTVELRPLTIAFLALTAVTIAISIILPCLLNERLWPLLCPVPLCKKSSGHYRGLLYDKKKTPGEVCTCPKSYFDATINLKDYTVPVLRNLKQ